MQRRVSLVDEEGGTALTATRCTPALLALVSISEHRTYSCDALQCSCTTRLFPGPGAARRLPCGVAWAGGGQQQCAARLSDVPILQAIMSSAISALLVPPIRPAI